MGHSRPSRSLVVVAICAAFTTALVGLTAQDQQLVVDRNVHLRDQPSGTGNSIELLAPPTALTLLDAAKTSGYDHVRDANGHEGWVWAKNVHLAAAAALIAPAAHHTVATSLSPDWDKPEPNETTFDGVEGPCGPLGAGGNDSGTIHRKNRTDVPSAYHDVSFAAVAGLDYPKNATTHRDSPSGWTQAQLDIIKPFEGEAVTVEGFIFVIRPQTGSSEKTNCGQTAADDTDWHIAITENFGDLEPKALVVETTPRVRKDHPNWTTQTLAPFVKKNIPVRISGWTMLDPEHKNHLGVHRSTLWEIHPIMKIELFKNNAWVDLDAQL
jgi:hypothetical protein